MTAPKRIARVLKRRREPGEIGTPVISIRNQCLECCGYQPGEVEQCTAPACWLWPWRFGHTPEAAARYGKNVGFGGADDNASSVPRQKSRGRAPVFSSATAYKPPAEGTEHDNARNPQRNLRMGDVG